MGHAPGHLRDAFQAIVDENWPYYDEIFDDAPMPPDVLLWQLGTCSDIMPKDVCEQLDLPQGAPYAMGVGA
jgi:hypothetical protein